MSHIPASAMHHAKRKADAPEIAAKSPSAFALLAVGGTAALAAFGVTRLLRAI